MRRVRAASVSGGAAVMLLAAAAAGAAAAKPATAADAGAAACAPGEQRFPVAVVLSPPSDEVIAGVKIVLRYPQGAVAIPGARDDRSVRARVDGFPGGFTTLVNDGAGALSVVVASGSTSLDAGAIFRVRFDRCRDAAAPTATDFTCTVAEASRDTGALVEGATCTVSTP